MIDLFLFRNSLCLCLIFSVFYLEAKPFVLGHLQGQLGNQMFIIAATMSLALDHEAVAIFPDLKEKKRF